MDYQALADLLFPNVTETPDEVQARFPKRELDRKSTRLNSSHTS